jgi:hypothetical protein
MIKIRVGNSFGTIKEFIDVTKRVNQNQNSLWGKIVVQMEININLVLINISQY